jgi:hypothetical protein
MTEHTFSWPDGKRAAVSLTFDDARLTQPDTAFAILDRFGVKGTFYVSPDGVRARLDAWKAAVSAGHEIGNHTLTHPCSANFPWGRAKALEDYTLERMARELLDANALIEELLGVTPRTFAYPCGQTFVGRGENQKSYVPLVAKHFLVGRGAFDEITTDPVFCDLALVTSAELDRRHWDDAKSAVEATTADGRQATLPDTLEKVCEYCTDAKHGIWIDTVAAVGQHVRQMRER